jgi:hypothetical protein
VQNGDSTTDFRSNAGSRPGGQRGEREGMDIRTHDGTTPIRSASPRGLEKATVMVCCDEVPVQVLPSPQARSERGSPMARWKGKLIGRTQELDEVKFRACRRAAHRAPSRILNSSTLRRPEKCHGGAKAYIQMSETVAALRPAPGFPRVRIRQRSSCNSRRHAMLRRHPF